MPRLAAKGHLLFVAYHFPPHRTVASIRSRNLARHLSLQGWLVTVLTLDTALWRRRGAVSPMSLVGVPPTMQFILVRPTLKWLNTDDWRQTRPQLPWWLGSPLRRLMRLFSLELSLGWLRPAVQTTRTAIAPLPDIILAPGGPFLSSFSLAHRLTARCHKPYFLDYRDLWTTGNPHRYSSLVACQRPLEINIVRRAAAMVAVSNGLARGLECNLPLRKPTNVITNGYDPDLLRDVQPTHFPEPAVVYAGTLSSPLRTLTPVIQALRLLDERNLPCRFHYYGVDGTLVANEALRFGLLHRTMMHGNVPRQHAAAAAQGAHRALLIASVQRHSKNNEHGVLAANVFKVLGSGTQILLIALEDSEARHRIDAPRYASCGDKIDRIACVLRAPLQPPPYTHLPPPQVPSPNASPRPCGYNHSTLYSQSPTTGSFFNRHQPTRSQVLRHPCTALALTL